MKKSLILGALLLAASPAFALNSLNNDSNPTNSTAYNSIHIKGKVVDSKTGEPIPYANITVIGSTMGVTTKSDGTFSINIPTRDSGKLRISFIGYTSKEVSFGPKSSSLDISLKPSSFNIEEVVVSANRTETRRRLAPVLVNVTDEKLFDATSSVNLDQALKFNPGIRVEDNCQNCGFNQVRINGLEGSYSQILINSRSIFSSLAGVYGLEMIPTDMIERVEVVRGGGSALYGSSAVGGTINIITKAPNRNMTSVSYTSELMQSNFDKPSHNVNFFSSVISDDYKAGISIFGRMKHRAAIDLPRPDSKQKDEKDGFSELPRLYSSTIGTSAFFSFSPESKISLDYFYTQEERRGGNNLDKPEHEADIAESLRHRMHTGVLKLDQFLFESKGHFSAFVAGSNTIRNSYYGGGPLSSEIIEGWLKTHPTMDDIDGAISALRAYGLTKNLTLQAGAQYVHNFDKLLFMPAELTLGIEHDYDKLNDNSGNRPKDIDQTINTTSGIFQNEWKNDRFGLLLGMRYDHVKLHSEEKTTDNELQKLDIITPRATLRYNPTENINFRFSYAEGFRAPAYFNEDLHVAFAGGEGVPHILADDLKEERSRSFTGSVDYYTSLSEDFSVNLMLEGFYTKIMNKFTEVNMGKYFLIRNVDQDGNKNNAEVYGANFETRLGYKNVSSLQLGVTVQRSLYEKAQAPMEDDAPDLKFREMMRTPDVYGYFVYTYKPVQQFAINVSGDYTGKMKVPHVTGDAIGNYITNTGDPVVIDSKPFFTLNTKLSYTLDVNQAELEFNVGVNNILNSFQKDFDEGPNRASDFIYGPKNPRMIFAGIKMSL